MSHLESLKPMRSTLAVVILSTGLFASAGAQGAEASAQRGGAPSVASVVRRASAAVVLIRTFDSRGRVVALGSGFVAADGRVVTNAHVIAGAASAEIVGAGGQPLLTCQFAEALNVRLDVAILPRVGIARASRLDLAAASPAVGEHIVAIGAPEGLTNTVSDGIVSAVRSVEARTLLQITAPISKGSSGGPLLNMSGQIVGIAAAMLSEGQNLNFAVPAAEIRMMLNSPVGRYEFPPSTEQQARAANSSDAPTSERMSASTRPSPATRVRPSIFGVYETSTLVTYLPSACGGTNVEGSCATPQDFSAACRWTEDPTAEEYDRQVKARVTVRFPSPTATGCSVESYRHSPRYARDGLLILGPNDEGWLLEGSPAQEGTAAYVGRVVSTGTGRLALSAYGRPREGYQTDRGLFFESRSLNLVEQTTAERVDLPLSLRTGIYDVETRTEYRSGTYSSSTAWQGTAIVGTVGDSLFLIVSMTNAAGGSTGAFGRTTIEKDGSFSWQSDDRKKTLRGHLAAGRFEADWYDEREKGAYFKGFVVGNRR